MLDFSEQTYANILARQLNRVTNSLDKREGSLIMTSLGPESWTIEGIYRDLNKVQLNGFALTASGEALDYKVAERSLTRNAATAAQREGYFDKDVPIGNKFSTIEGSASLRFTVTSSLGLQSDGYYHFVLTCDTVGTVGNGYSGKLLPITFVQGLTVAMMTTIIIAGTDEEDDEALRSRYILSLSEQPFGGNIASYRNYILALENIGAVQIYPVYKGGGTVLCSILDANYDPATQALVDYVQYLICPPDAGNSTPSANGYGVAPIGAQVDIGAATALTINVTTTVQLSAGYTIEAIQSKVEDAIEEYLLLVRRSWGNPLQSNTIDYPVYVYISRINVAILAIEGVVNVLNTALNGVQEDIHCTEDGTIQELPVLGAVVIS